MEKPAEKEKERGSFFSSVKKSIFGSSKPEKKETTPAKSKLDMSKSKDEPMAGGFQAILDAQDSQKTVR